MLKNINKILITMIITVIIIHIFKIPSPYNYISAILIGIIVSCF